MIVAGRATIRARIGSSELRTVSTRASSSRKLIFACRTCFAIRSISRTPLVQIISDWTILAHWKRRRSRSSINPTPEQNPLPQPFFFSYTHKVPVCWNCTILIFARHTSYTLTKRLTRCHTVFRTPLIGGSVIPILCLGARRTCQACGCSDLSSVGSFWTFVTPPGCPHLRVRVMVIWTINAYTPFILTLGTVKTLV